MLSDLVLSVDCLREIANRKSYSTNKLCQFRKSSLNVNLIQQKVRELCAEITYQPILFICTTSTVSLENSNRLNPPCYLILNTI